MAGPEEPGGRYSRIPNSIDALWAAVQQVWDELTIGEVRKHTNRMQDRVDEVLKAKWWHTSF